VSEGQAWSLVITPRAEKDLKRLTPHDQARIRSAIDSLTAGPGHGDLKRLQGSTDEWRLRVGDWRVRFHCDLAAHSVVILRVLPRGQAYR
jgi:mRNA interferase RelE/StbE